MVFWGTLENHPQQIIQQRLSVQNAAAVGMNIIHAGSHNKRKVRNSETLLITSVDMLRHRK